MPEWASVDLLVAVEIYRAAANWMCNQPPVGAGINVQIAIQSVQKMYTLINVMPGGSTLDAKK